MHTQVLSKIMKYCARTEHCTADVIRKLGEWEVGEKEAEEILQVLYQEKFVDDARYALNFVREKWNLYRWGKNKIRHHLEVKEIPDTLIDRSLASIAEDDYLEQLDTLMQARRREVSSADRQEVFRQLAAFAIGRGFEEDYVEAWIDQHST